jgi:mannitol 2-dehydrogenase
MTRPSAATVPSVSATMPVPGYDRTRVSTGIVHFGVGGFHRAHEAMYLDRLMNDGEALDWGICGVGVLPGDARMQAALDPQDCLFTLVVKHPDGTLEPRLVGSIVEYLFAPDDPEAVIEKMASPASRIVSLTVTEGGYNIDPVTGEFGADEPGMRRDLQPGATPATVFGLVTEALARRRSRGLEPFTVMSCDNIEGNGDVARRAFTAFAGLRDAELGSWVGREVPFPNSMVDRITPVTTDEDRAVVAERFGVDDAWPVVCEPFTQWVLEDHFAAGRPPLEDAGVQLVKDVRPYELMKLRLLNASHQALCYLGYLSGYRYAHEVCQDPLFTDFLRAYMGREATPTLSPVPGVDLDAYQQTLIERFANPEIRDTLARLCADSSDRIPKWLLPVIREQLTNGGEMERSALVVAAWARYAEGVDEQGAPIDVVDRLREPLMAAAGRQRTEPTAFLAERQVFGDLIDQPRFVAAYTEALRSLHERGARATLESLVSPGPPRPGDAT